MLGKPFQIKREDESGYFVLAFSSMETEIPFNSEMLNEGSTQSRERFIFSPFFFQIKPIPQIVFSKGVHT